MAQTEPRAVDRIRARASQYISAARRSGLVEVQIRAGTLERELGLHNRTPAICSALTSRKFLEDNQIHLTRKEGPPSGQSTSMLYTYSLDEADEPKKSDLSAFMALRGIGKETYAALGGAEAFHKREREAWGD